MEYNSSDRLAIVLACLAGVMAIMLFLIEKTPVTVLSLLLLMLALSVYPILHFTKRVAWRVLALVACGLGTTLFGWYVWPHGHLASASSHPQQTPTAQQQTPQQKEERKPEEKKKPQNKATPKTSVEQRSQGDNSPNINVEQRSSGANSPNITTVGPNSPVTINSGSDPEVKARLDKIEKLLQAQQGKNASPEELLKKYPLGYVIFDVDYQNSVFPYQSKALQDWVFDWTVVNLTSLNNDELKLKLPDMRNKSRDVTVSGNTFTTKKRVGPFGVINPIIVGVNGISVKGEILAITDKGVVFLLGLSNAVPRNAARGRTSTPPGKN